MSTPKYCQQEIGRRIRTLNELSAAVDSHKSLISPTTPFIQHSSPASFVYNMNACVVHRMMKEGLYIYKSLSSKRYKKQGE